MEIERLKKEIEIIRKEYPDAVLDGDFRFVIISNFPLPSGWDVSLTELMIEIPGGYPVTPPDNFYVVSGLRFRKGNTPGSYDETDKLGKRWGRFSWHIDGKWQPHADAPKGDNLFTFILSIKKRLEILE